MMDDLSSAEEPSQRFARRQSQVVFEKFVAARAAGGFFNLNGEWQPINGGPVIETTVDDPDAVEWLYQQQGDCDGGGTFELLTKRYYKPT